MSNPEDRPSRKRSMRDCDDGACDFAPLSKRINNLHLTRPPHQDPFQGGSKEDEVHQHPQHPHHQQNGHMNGFNGQVMHNNSPHNQQNPEPDPSWITDQMIAQYAPQIDQVDSPYYYEHNKLLFALYLERLQRNPQNRPLS
ncbi:uncharacterized protein LOC132196998 isoform X2 [Neocloeon triangulifer]|uniref:uncharacterized protein LOC132196998 isoform X2 n=1 Tax=Neocloeon triangulifer TaxID=2078957 RepID=UPI00286F908E|nr:uncharacterized protein LOC132196998 isoform X2 [Neocloeon triangulifer]